jgi:topoisomerase-4 subunit A
MATDIIDPNDPFNAIADAPFDSALSDRYLVYALSTITARSLPDLRDGMKPVHRRLLWAMRALRMDPGTAFKKSARVVGEVIGKYHPHGDQSVYDAMVRLAQDFSVRYPLVEGQGNFGNIDGDNAAAFRYTEARLTQVAIDLMAGLDEDAVAFKPTYNNEEQEPELFPGAFPNLLANGAAGIAVGMATNIPPHNVAELYDAAIALIDRSGDLTGFNILDFQPAVSSSIRPPRSRRVMRPDAAGSACARAGRSRISGAGHGPRSSPKFRTVCRRAS